MMHYEAALSNEGESRNILNKINDLHNGYVLPKTTDFSEQKLDTPIEGGN